MDISSIRTTYSQAELSESDANPLPAKQFEIWFNQAVNSEITEVNAMTLATADKNGIPSARIVLLKGLKNEGLVFFTNYNSKKSHDIFENPNVAVVFFWKELERQVRIKGIVEKIDEAENNEYFNSRPFESRVGAIASPQSAPITKLELEENYKRILKSSSTESIKRPEHWGGFLINPMEWEFWQGRPGRLHDRLRYKKENHIWKIERLAP